MYCLMAVVSNFVRLIWIRIIHLSNLLAIVPQETPVSIEGNVFTTELEPTTFAVYKFTKK